jgi:hypothetical protein
MAYLSFKEVSDTGKTKVFNTLSVHVILGQIRWYAPWRRYAYFPVKNTLYDAGCLKEIVQFIDELMLERKNSKSNS